jgi:hypothetical protein
MFVLKKLLRYIFKIKNTVKQTEYEKGPHLNDVKIGIDYLCDVLTNVFEISLSLLQAKYVYSVNFAMCHLSFAVYYNQIPIFGIQDGNNYQSASSWYCGKLIINLPYKINLPEIFNTYYGYRIAKILYDNRYSTKIY